LDRWSSDRRRRPGRGAWLAAALVFGAAAVSAETPTRIAFSRLGVAVADRDLAWMRSRVPAQVIRVEDPYEATAVEFEAVSFEALLDAVYSPSWRDGDEVLFRCRDGYQPSVSVARFRRHRAWLAFARVGSNGFTIRKPESGEVKTIDLAPFYLVWESDDAKSLRLDGDHGWPYQLVGVDLIGARDRFPAMAPPAGASESVELGFRAFRVHCSRCHRINGEGGTLGPELNGPTPFIRAVGADWLRRWIDDPAALSPKTRMPRLNPALPDRAQTIDTLVAYLDAMATAKTSTAVETHE